LQLNPRRLGSLPVRKSRSIIIDIDNKAEEQIMEAIEKKVLDIIESTRQSAARVATIGKRLEVVNNYEHRESQISKELLEQTLFMTQQLLETLIEHDKEKEFVAKTRMAVNGMKHAGGDLKTNLKAAEQLLRDAAHKLSWNAPRKDEDFMKMMQEVHAAALQIRYLLR
jgi:hypothetical protein